MDDSKMPRIRRKEDLPDVMTMPLVAKTLGCSLTVAYVPGSDLANCLTPSISTDLDPT